MHARADGSNRRTPDPIDKKKRVMFNVEVLDTRQHEYNKWPHASSRSHTSLCSAYNLSTKVGVFQHKPTSFHKRRCFLVLVNQTVAVSLNQFTGNSCFIIHKSQRRYAVVVICNQSLLRHCTKANFIFITMTNFTVNAYQIRLQQTAANWPLLASAASLSSQKWWLSVSWSALPPPTELEWNWKQHIKV